MINPSFEKQSFQDWPDFVTPYRVEGHPAIGEPGVLWSADTEKPFRGKHCLRVTRRTFGDGPICWGFFAIAYPPPVDVPTPYVFSFYARGQKDGDRVFVRVTGMEPGEKDVSLKLTTEWKRYSVSGRILPDRYRDKSILICPISDGTTLWFDALQMEPGTEPTPFTED
jgi:hypothetical protein